MDKPKNKTLDIESVPYGTYIKATDYADLMGVKPSRITVLKHHLDRCVIITGEYIIHTKRNETFFSNASPMRGGLKS